MTTLTVPGTRLRPGPAPAAGPTAAARRGLPGCAHDSLRLERCSRLCASFPVFARPFPSLLVLSRLCASLPCKSLLSVGLLPDGCRLAGPLWAPRALHPPRPESLPIRPFRSRDESRETAAASKPPGRAHAWDLGSAGPTTLY